MQIGIIGGKLQGTEVAYLAKKAGIKTVLIDKTHNTPASGICDEEVVFDVSDKSFELLNLLNQMDFVIPAMENPDALEALKAINKDENINILFDFDAYDISSSKIKTDKIIHEGNFPYPRYFPNADPPYILKPSHGSGSSSVEYIKTKEELLLRLEQKDDPDNWVAQEYISGESYSVEVIGTPGNYNAYSVTQIHLDEMYDCNMVSCPVELNEDIIEQFKLDSIELAKKLNLHGLMDVEAILDDDQLKIIEIDARFPSQTPIAIFHSTGVNLLVELLKVFSQNKGKDSEELCSHFVESEDHNMRTLFSVYEHFQVDNENVLREGEHVFGDTGPLTIRESFFGSDWAITDFKEGHTSWQAACINSAHTKSELDTKRCRAYDSISSLGNCINNKESV